MITEHHVANVKSWQPQCQSVSIFWLQRDGSVADDAAVFLVYVGLETGHIHESKQRNAGYLYLQSWFFLAKWK